MLFFKDTRVSHIVILLVVLLPFLIPDFVIPVFMKAEGKTYLERVEIYWRQDVPSPSLMGSAMQKIGRHFFLWLFVIYGCTIVAGTAGHGNAANQREYLVLESDPNDVVLRIYDDVFIVGHRKGETNELDQSLRILRITNESGIKLIRADIGPLIAASTSPVDTPPSEKKPNKEPTRLKQNSK
jgi:hypothetical protein